MTATHTYGLIEDEEGVDGNKAVRTMMADKWYAMPDRWYAVDQYRQGDNSGVVYENPEGLQVCAHHEPDASHGGKELGEWLIHAGRHLLEYGNDDREMIFSARFDEEFVAVEKVVKLARLGDL